MDLIYALIVFAHASIVDPAVSHAEDAEPVEPEQRGSFASSQAKIVGSFSYRPTKLLMYFSYAEMILLLV